MDFLFSHLKTSTTLFFLFTHKPKQNQLRVLARGAFGVVVEAREVETGEHVAFKLIERRRRRRRGRRAAAVEGDAAAAGQNPSSVANADANAVAPGSSSSSAAQARPAPPPPLPPRPNPASAPSASASSTRPFTKYAEREILNHASLSHPHVVELRAVFLTERHLGIAMELASGGDLFALVAASSRGLPEADARWYFQQIVCALDYCHRAGVANRDVKLENALLAEPERPLVKLCDFGYSKHEVAQSAPGSRVGTPAYLAPEVVMATGGQTYDGKAADVWSCGVMLYAMLCACYPFGRPEDAGLPADARLRAMLRRILAADAALGDLAVSEPCADLLRGMLVADPARRLTLAQVQAHPWFLEDLPAGVAALNDRLLAEQRAEREREEREEREGGGGGSGGGATATTTTAAAATTEAAAAATTTATTAQPPRPHRRRQTWAQIRALLAEAAAEEDDCDGDGDGDGDVGGDEDLELDVDDALAGGGDD